MKKRQSFYENMLAENVPLQMILKFTGLTPADIDNLNNDNFEDA